MNPEVENDQQQGNTQDSSRSSGAMDERSSTLSQGRQIIRPNTSGLRSRMTVSGGKASTGMRANSQSQTQAAKEGTPGIERTTFILMICAAIALDIFSIIANFIAPGIGGVITTIIITPAGTVGFYLWFKIHGISFTKSSRWITALAVPLIEFIPVANILPAWTVEILIFNATIKAEQKLLRK